MRFLAMANLSVQGRSVAVGDVAELVETPEVADCVTLALLVPERADGTFPDPPPPQPIRCCGR